MLCIEDQKRQAVLLAGLYALYSPQFCAYVSLVAKAALSMRAGQPLFQ
jgi:hypothetical protein